MRASRLITGLLAAVTTLTSASACSHTYQAAGDVVPTNVIGLSVKNENFLDMDVYAVADGLATRVGTVTGNSSRRFVLDASVATQDLRIVATPIGGNGRASSGTISVVPGQTIDFRIGSFLSNSSVLIR